MQTSFHRERQEDAISIIRASDLTFMHIIQADAEQNRSLSSFAEDTDVRRASSRGIIPQAKIKTIKMTFIIVCGKSTEDLCVCFDPNSLSLFAVFISCWSPYVVFDLLQVYGMLPQTQTTIAVATFIQSLAPLNSAANPIIYCLCTTHICADLRWGIFHFYIYVMEAAWFVIWCISRKIKFIDWLARTFCCCCPRNGFEGEASFQRTTTQHTTTTDGRGRSALNSSATAMAAASAVALPLHVRRSMEQRATNGVGVGSTKKHAVFVHDPLYKSKSALNNKSVEVIDNSARRTLLATRSQPNARDMDIISEAV